jgi:hypothetical protein
MSERQVFLEQLHDAVRAAETKLQDARESVEYWRNELALRRNRFDEEKSKP